LLFDATPGSPNQTKDRSEGDRWSPRPGGRNKNFPRVDRSRPEAGCLVTQDFRTRNTAVASPQAFRALTDDAGIAL